MRTNAFRGCLASVLLLLLCAPARSSAEPRQPQPSAHVEALPRSGDVRKGGDSRQSQIYAAAQPAPAVQLSLCPDPGENAARPAEAVEYLPFLISGARLRITDSLLAVISLLLIVVAAILGIFARRTEAGTRQVADAANRSAETSAADKSAYVFERICDGGADSLLVAEPNDVERGGEPRPSTICCSYQFRNYGKTPATILAFSVELTIERDRPALAPERFKLDAGCRPLDDCVLGAGESTRQIETARAFCISDNQRNDLLAQRLHLWLFGHVVWDDVFGSRYMRLFVWKYDPQRKTFRLDWDERSRLKKERAS